MRSERNKTAAKPIAIAARREKRSISLHSHRTSVALETPFWAVIDDAAQSDGSSLAALIARIDDQRIAEKSSLGLAAYLRVWALAHARTNPDA